MQLVLFLLVTLGFAGGILLRSFVLVPSAIVWLGIVVAVGLGCLYLLARRRGDGVAPASHRLLYGAVGLCLVMLGIGRLALVETELARAVQVMPTSALVTLTGQVVREPDVRTRQTLVTVETADTRILVATDRYTTVQYGDTVTVTGRLAVPVAFASDLGRTFDYRGYLAARGVTHTMSFADMTILAPAERRWLPWLYSAKQAFLDALARVIPAPEVGLGAGLLLGVQSSLGDELESAFRTTGIIHIVVLSGYNIMLVVAFVMYVLSFLLPFRWRLLVGIGAVAIFALLVGYSPSVMRASVMAILFLSAAWLGRPYLVLRMLVVAACIMLVFNPYLLRYDVGFQLSFMATLGLLLVAPQLEMAFMKVTAWLSIRSFIVATVATQIAVAPLILYHIGEWSLVAVPVNVLVLPVVPIAMLLTFVAGLVALVSTTLATPVAMLATLSLSYIITVAEQVAAWPYAAAPIPPFPGWWVVVMYAVLAGVWWYGWRRRHGLVVDASVRPSAEQWSAVTAWQVDEEVDQSPFFSRTPTIMPVSPALVASKKAAKRPPHANAVATQASVPIFFR